MTRRAAAMPAAPAPTTTISASRGKGAAAMRKGAQTASAEEPARKPRREIVISWFPKFDDLREHPANLPHRSRGGNGHGERLVRSTGDA